MYTRYAECGHGGDSKITFIIYMVHNGILFILNAVGKREKSFPTEKEK